MNWLDVFNYLFWLPIVFWVGYFFFARYVAYPITLRKFLRKGETWVYIPQWWKTKKAFWARFFSVTISLFTILFSTLCACWVIGLVSPRHALFGCLFFPIFVLLSVFVFRRSSKFVYSLQRSTYFLFYRRMLHNSQKNGRVMNDSDLRSRTSWEVQRTFLRTEKSVRHLRYNFSAAKTKKIPKDLYAEAVL